MPRQIFTIEVDYPLLDDDGDLMPKPSDWDWEDFQDHYSDCVGSYITSNSLKIVQASSPVYSDTDEAVAKENDTTLLELGIHR